MDDNSPSDSLPKKPVPRAKAARLNLAAYKPALAASGLTEGQVLVRIGCTRSTYRKWVAGYEGVKSLTYAMRLAAVLGVPMRALFLESERG